MQKQLVLAALFATAQAATCADANTAIALAADAANTAAKAGLDAAKKTADQAVLDTKATYDAAVKDEKTWTDAMSAFVAEQLKATKDFNDAEKDQIAKKATRDALQLQDIPADASAVPPVLAQTVAIDSTANKLLEVYKTKKAADDANTKATATTDPSLIFSDEAAKTILASLKKNTEEHEKLRTTAETARATALSNWDAKNDLAASTVLTAAATLKFSQGNITVRAITASTATGAAETMRKCTATGIGLAGAASRTTAQKATDIWNKGSHNQVAGLAPAGADKNAATEYAAEYLNCTLGTKGYTKQVEDAAAISAGTGAGTDYAKWLAAQKLLETRGYLFGKLRHVCMQATNWGVTTGSGAPILSYLASRKDVAATPCARSDQFEKTYKNTYPGDQADDSTKGTPDAQWPVTGSAAGATGKLGDFAADSTYTKTTAGAIPEYTAAVVVTKAGVAGLSLYLDRDVKYGLWQAKVKDTANLMVTENKAKVQEAILTLLATVYTSGQSTATNGKFLTLAVAGTQAKAVQDAFNTKEDDRLALGVGSDELVTTPASPASFFVAGQSSPNAHTLMVTLADKFNAERTIAPLFTAAKKSTTISKATLLTLAYFQASIDFHDSNTKWVAAKADQARAKTAQDLTAGALKKAKTDATIKAYLSNIQADALVKAKAEYNVANALYTRMLNTKTTSEENASGGASAKTHNNDLSTAAYALATAQYKVGNDAATTARDNAAKAVQANTDFTASQKLVITAAENNCKAVGYALAQSTLKSITVAGVTASTDAGKVKAAYLIKSARPAATPEASVAGSNCAYGPVTDGTAKPRPVCAEGLCCGAANKFLRDGTKLTVETCQKNTDISYTFYPNLKAGATVAPTAEQWRFSCISGAKNLAATATAALAAAYLMA